DHEKVSQSTVVRIKQRKKETGTFSDKPKPGCLRLLTGCYERKVLWYIPTGECTNAVSVQKKLKTDEGIILSNFFTKPVKYKNSSFKYNVLEAFNLIKAGVIEELNAQSENITEDFHV
ncbi:9416_t:CDS:2, partial [Cetraspora pellucida]